MAISHTLRAAPSADAAPDATLVLRAREGEQWAQAAIYQRHAPRLLNLGARLLGNRADAMDLVQEVFVESLEGLGSLRDPSALGAWLLTRALKKARRRLRWLRWARLFGIHHSAEVSLALLATHRCSPEVLAELEQVSLMLEGLPERQRVAWILHVVEGETLSRVAALSCTSLATTKRDLAAAKAALEVLTEDHR